MSSRSPKRSGLLVLAAFSLLGVALYLGLRKPEPSGIKPVELPFCRLQAFTSKELWQPTAVTVRASGFRYEALDAAILAAREELEAGRIDRSLLSHIDLVARFDGHPQALAALGRYYSALRDRPKLRRVLQRLELLEPSYPPFRLLQAEEMLLEGQLAEAEAGFLALQFSGGFVEARARLFLASMAYQRAELERSRTWFQSVREAELDAIDARQAFERLGQALAHPETPVPQDRSRPLP